jgi:hypothetical protein
MSDIMKRIQELEQELGDLKEQVRRSIPRMAWCYTVGREAGCFYTTKGVPSAHPHGGPRYYWRVFAIPVASTELIANLEQVVREASMVYIEKRAEDSNDES